MSTIRVNVPTTPAAAVSGSVTITITTDVDWSVAETGGTSVLTFTPNHGNDGTNSVVVSFADNENYLPRTMTFQVTGSDSSTVSSSITQSQADPDTDYVPSWQDVFFNFTTPSQQYRVKDQYNTVIYEGCAYSPTSGNASVCITDIVRNFVSSTMSFSTGLVNNGGDDLFKLYAVSGSTEYLIANYYVHNDWTYDSTINYEASVILSNPINGHFDYRQYIPFTTYNHSDTTYKIMKDDTASYVAYSHSSMTCTYGMNGVGVGIEEVSLNKNDGTVKYVSYDKLVCGKEYALIYRNRKGGWDSFLIEGGSKKTDNFENDNYSQSFNNNYPAQHGNITFHKKITSSWKFNTGWLNDTQSKNLAFNLLSSPDVYLQDLAAGKIMAVNITNSSVDYKTFWNNGRQMVNYEIDVEESQTKNFL